MKILILVSILVIIAVLFIALYNIYSPLFHRLIKKLINANPGDDLVMAILDDDIVTVNSLFNNLQDKNSINYLYNGHTPLTAATTRNSFIIVERLINAGADVNVPGEQGFTPLMKASHEGFIDIAQLLIKHKASVNAQAAGLNNQTALYLAASNRRIEVLKLLLANGADVNLALDDGFTPLMIASQIGNIEIVQLLIKHNAYVNAQAAGCDNATALFYAVKKGYLEVIKLLLENGADVNLALGGGFTPLMFSSQNGNIEIVQLLIKYNANVNAQAPGFHNITALYQAVSHGHAEVVKLLLENGADVDLTVAGGFTCLDKAREMGYEDIEAILEAYIKRN